MERSGRSRLRVAEIDHSPGYGGAPNAQLLSVLQLQEHGSASAFNGIVHSSARHVVTTSSSPAPLRSSASGHRPAVVQSTMPDDHEWQGTSNQAIRGGDPQSSVPAYLVVEPSMLDHTVSRVIRGRATRKRPHEPRKDGLKKMFEYNARLLDSASDIIEEVESAQPDLDRVLETAKELKSTIEMRLKMINVADLDTGMRPRFIRRSVRGSGMIQRIGRWSEHPPRRPTPGKKSFATKRERTSGGQYSFRGQSIAYGNGNPQQGYPQPPSEVPFVQYQQQPMLPPGYFPLVPVPPPRFFWQGSQRPTRGPCFHCHGIGHYANRCPNGEDQRKKQ